MTRFVCKCTVDGTSCWISSANGIYEFKDGFYVDGEYELSTFKDAKYWVPPHKIEYIEIQREVRSMRDRLLRG